MKYCPECGKPLANEAANFCDNCGAKLLAAPTITVQPPEGSGAGSSTPAPEPVTLVQPDEEKSTAIAAICSLVIPGLGQVYDGKLERGFLIFFGTIIGFFIFIIPGLCVWAFGIYDAYEIACKMNNKEIPFLPTKTSHLLLFIILAIVTVIVAFVLLALLAFAVFASPVMMHPV
jgi:TM2 domain-containing membrane protein YozV